MKIKITAFLLCFLLLFAGCGEREAVGNPSESENEDIISETAKSTEKATGNKKPITNNGNNGEMQGESSDLGGDDTSFGEDIKDMGAYDGYFENDSDDVIIECISGTQNAYTLEGNTLTFTALSADSVYSVSGSFSGNIVIDVGDNYKFDLELCGFSLVCASTNPITVNSGNEIAIKAKKDTKN